MTVVPDALQLFVSSVSTTALEASARASKKYLLGEVAVGTVTVTVPGWLAPAAGPGIDRAPVKSMSPALY